MRVIGNFKLMTTQERLPLLVLLSLLALVSAGCQSIPERTADQAIRFAEEDISTWRHRVFNGETQYQVESLDGQVVLKAISSNSASAILKEMSVDLRDTPYINWRWRIGDTFDVSINEQSKSGDDYPARLYVVASDGYLAWEVIAVNYVWFSNQPVGTHWPNAWTDKSQMLALRSGNEDANQWRSEKRNLREDFQQLFNREIDTIKAVAIMVDSDNTGGQATSYFSDVYFSAE